MTPPAERLTLRIEKPAAGGRMLARHEGRIVLVDGAIPGERVVAQIERVQKGVAFARTLEVLDPSPDRRSAADRRCGGSLFAHIAYARQLQLKAEIVQDAFARIARHPVERPPVAASPEHGYRMRARLHVLGARIGFFREGTHEVCDAAATGHLTSAAIDWMASAERMLRTSAGPGVAGVELAENIAGDRRVCHLELEPGSRPGAFTGLAAGLDGLTARTADGVDLLLAGSPAIVDVLHAREEDPATALRLRRDVRSFFQGNRFLLEPLARRVISLVPDGPVLDLYAGVGLFGLSLAALGRDAITLVEGDASSGADLLGNAESVSARVRVERTSVESFLSGAAPAASRTVIVDPPRTGLSRTVLPDLVRLRPRRIVYVSCDAPTLARDAGGLLASGYTLAGISAMDLFPNTAHVETIAVFDARPQV